jgi:hypothetical protein
MVQLIHNQSIGSFAKNTQEVWFLEVIFRKILKIEIHICFLGHSFLLILAQGRHAGIDVNWSRAIVFTLDNSNGVKFGSSKAEENTKFLNSLFYRYGYVRSSTNTK